MSAAPVEIGPQTVLPADRRPVRLQTADGLTLVGELALPLDGPPVATLTCAGLSGLVYGVLDPDEVGLRGFGAVPDEAANELRVLFPREFPYLFADF